MSDLKPENREGEGLTKDTMALKALPDVLYCQTRLRISSGRADGRKKFGASCGLIMPSLSA